MVVKFVLISLLLHHVLCKTTDKENRISKIENIIVRQGKMIERLEKSIQVQGNINIRQVQHIYHLEDSVRSQNELIKQLNAELDTYKNIKMQLSKDHKEEEKNNSGIILSAERDNDGLAILDKKRSVKRDAKKKRLLTADGSSSTIGFYVYLSKQETTVGNGHTIIFDHVVTNIGGAYNKHAGDFVVPFTGVYVLSYTIICAWQSSIYVELVVNGNVVGGAYAESNNYNFDGTASSTVVLSLNQGDTCVVRTHQITVSHGVLWSSVEHGRTSFSGWRISS